MPTAHLAIDLGASSGRAIIGVLDGNPKQLRLEELHRFEHLPCPTPFGPVWDLTGIWLHLLAGLKQAAGWCSANQLKLSSVGVDAWGVDWCLVGSSGELLTLPHCYRDPQNEAACQSVLKKIGGRERLYQRNGIQLMAINSLFQVAARFEREPKLFDAAHRMLFVPDLLHYWLSGVLTTERTIASTSAMLDLESGDWDRELLATLNLPAHLFGPLIEPGVIIGTLRCELAQAAGITNPVKIIAPGAHDTAAAVAAVPAIDLGPTWAFLSSGTWSLLGAELSHPIATAESCAAPFTNERGINGSIRFLKNIAGLWLLQELRRELVQHGSMISFAEMTDQARAALPFRTLINPNDARFAAPGAMIEKISDFAGQTDQPVPATTGQLVRCCLDSLALCYRDTINRLELILGHPIDVLHIVGGGTQNELLNELTVTAIQRPVIAGPVEATAVGNLLIQSLGCGELSSVTELRNVVANSFLMHRYEYHFAEENAREIARVLARYESLIPE